MSIFNKDGKVYPFHLFTIYTSEPELRFCKILGRKKWMQDIERVTPESWESEKHEFLRQRLEYRKGNRPGFTNYELIEQELKFINRIEPKPQDEIMFERYKKLLIASLGQDKCPFKPDALPVFHYLKDHTDWRDKSRWTYILNFIEENVIQEKINAREYFRWIKTHFDPSLGDALQKIGTAITKERVSEMETLHRKYCNESK